MTMSWRKRRCSSSSAAIIAGNEDLLTEILVLLPVKSVVRFKSVSKTWQSLISGESFARRHFRRSRGGADDQQSFVLSQFNRITQIYTCDPTVKKLLRFSLPSRIKLHNLEYVKILQSINGLLLLVMKSRGQEDRRHYCVFNPTTKCSRFIHVDGYQNHRPCNMYLIFDPSQSEYYKLFMRTGAYPSFYFLYDSATHQWSHRRGEMKYDDLGFTWSRSLQLHHNLIVACSRRGHLDSTLPNYPEPESYFSYMYESNGHLNLLQLKQLLGKQNKCCFRVGEMMADRSKWVICKEATIDVGSNMVASLGLIREHRIEDSAFLFHVPGRLLIYRFSDDDDDQHLEVLVDYRSHYFYAEDQYQFDHALPFIHTLASV